MITSEYVHAGLEYLTVEAFQRERQLANIRVQRNAIQADLRQIQADLRLDLLQQVRERGEPLDSKSILILEWHQRFTRLLAETEQPHQLFIAFRDLLKEILVDSIFRSALDEQCLLGNDGEVYTEIGLEVFRRMDPVHFQRHSPLHPTEVPELVTAPHPCAGYMVAWLKRQGVNHSNEQNAILEEAYQQQNKTARQDPPPVINDDEAMRKILKHQAQRKLKREQERNDRVQAHRIRLEKQRRDELVPLLRERFAPIEERVQAVAQQQLVQVAELNKDITDEINVLQPAIDHLEAEIAELVEREIGLKMAYDEAQDKIIGLRRTHDQLELKIIQLKREIRESVKGGLQSLATALAVIGVCALATWVASSILVRARASTSIIVAPASKGFLIKGSILF